MLSSDLLKAVQIAVPPAGGASFVLQNGVFVLSAEIDLTAAASTILLPPLAGYKLVRGVACFMAITKDGTITTAPTMKAGTNASHDNVLASQTVAGFTTQATNTAVTLAGISPANANLDLGALGLILEITSAAVLGTATFLRGRLQIPASGVYAY